MEITIRSKWQHKDGGVYEVVDKQYNLYYCRDEVTDRMVYCVWYKDQQGEIYVRTEKEFLEEFKPYEPVYEYRFLTSMKDGDNLMVSENWYQNAGELEKLYPYWVAIQRLDFTKRERE